LILQIVEDRQRFLELVVGEIVVTGMMLVGRKAAGYRLSKRRSLPKSADTFVQSTSRRNHADMHDVNNGGALR